jgi:plasmid stabilization system protein ParE
MKKVQVVWIDESVYDLEIIYDFLAEKSFNSATKIIDAILSRTRQLESFPQSGQVVENDKKYEKEYRYLVEGNYKIIYRLDEKAIFILAVTDTRQNPTKLKI